MPFDAPSFSELTERIRQDLATRLGVEVPAIRRTNAEVIAAIEATASFTLIRYMDWIADQVIYDTAEAEILDRWTAVWGLARSAAAAASGDVVFTGTDGVDIPAGTLLQRTDQVTYTTDALVTIAAGTATVAVTAENAGAAGNADAAEILNLVSPIAGVGSQATVDTGLAGGADSETDDSLRARLLDRVQRPPHGGSETDYLKWALETPTVTIARRGPNPRDELVWVYPQELGLGTVTVRFMADDGAGFMRVPTAQEVTDVGDYIEVERPVTADVTVVAPVAVPLDITLSITPDTAAVRAAVEAEIEDLLLREAEPGGTILISHIREAVSVAAGETDHTITLPASDVAHGTGEIAVPGTFTWT